MYVPRKLRKGNRRLSGTGKKEKQLKMKKMRDVNIRFVNLSAKACEGNQHYIKWCKRIDAQFGVVR